MDILEKLDTNSKKPEPPIIFDSKKTKKVSNNSNLSNMPQEPHEQVDEKLDTLSNTVSNLNQNPDRKAEQPQLDDFLDNELDNQDDEGSEEKTTPSEEPQSEKAEADLTRFSELMGIIDLELERLDWKIKQAQKYIKETYGQISRHLLSNEQLQDFIDRLKAMPSPFKVGEQGILSLPNPKLNGLIVTIEQIVSESILLVRSSKSRRSFEVAAIHVKRTNE